MSFYHVASSCVDLTPELAKEFYEMTPSPTERELDTARVNHLDRKRSDGLLVTFHWAKAKHKGESLRMNGQHSSTMLANLNGAFPEGLKVHLDEYKVDALEDLAMLFRQFDDRKSSRGPSDIAGAYQNLYPALHDVPNKIGKIAIDGIVFHERQLIGAPVKSGDDVYEWFNREIYYPFILWLGELFGMKTPELFRKEIVAAMYATFIANEEACQKFWASVARGGDEYDDTAPATVLDAWYQKAKKKEHRVPPKPAEYCQAGLFAWNAAMQQKTIKAVRTDMTKGWIVPLTS